MSHVLSLGTTITDEKLLRNVLSNEKLGTMSEKMRNINLGYSNHKLGYEISLINFDRPISWTTKEGFMFDAMDETSISKHLIEIENKYLKHKVINQLMNEGINYKIIKNELDHVILEYEV